MKVEDIKELQDHIENCFKTGVISVPVKFPDVVLTFYVKKAKDDEWKKITLLAGESFDCHQGGYIHNMSAINMEVPYGDSNT